MVHLFTHIKHLAGIQQPVTALRGDELKKLPGIENAWLLTEEGIITGFGSMNENPLSQYPDMQTTNCEGRFLLPAWCDSHTHIVFAATRESEFIDKIEGLDYATIAARGGGILHSAQKLNEMSEDQLFIMAWQRLNEVMRLGTGAIEIKSGYGLSVAGELKMLRVIKRLKEKAPIPVKATFLGAHAYPQEYKTNHEAYIRLITEEMLPVIAKDKLADYIDVFCENGFFSPAEMETVCNAGLRYGLKPKLHINQLSSTGGLQKALALNALTADHLEVMTDEDIQQLAASNTMGVLLPTAAFFLRMPFQPARALIRSGAAIALASDYNPGSSPSGNMNFVVSLSCIQMKMLPEEAINAATINGAFAMELQNETGSIAIGKKANFIITQPIQSLACLPYSFGSNLIEQAIINGQPI
jgi:imidazolonepropionase